MGFKQSTVLSNDLFGEVVSGCLAGLGIWTKPSPKVELSKPAAALTMQKTTSNVYPLRVVRVKDSNPHLAGRMVISGRMADVCAELDRLAA